MQTAAHFDTGTHLLGLNLLTYRNQEMSLPFWKIDRRQNIGQTKIRIFSDQHNISELERNF